MTKKFRYHILILFIFYAVINLQSCSSGKNIKSSVNTGTGSANKVKVNKDLLQRYANQLGVKPSDIKNKKLYSLLDEWIGTPYKYGGNTKKGVDCSGFVIQIYKNFSDKQLPRSSANLSKTVNAVSKNKLKEGDLVFFNFDAKNSHVGIYLRNGKFVHASTKSGVVISDLNAAWYIKRFNKGGPVNGVSLQ